MLGRAGGGTRVIQHAGPGLCEGNEFTNSLRRHAGMHDHHVRCADHQTNWRVIAYRIVGQFFAQKRRQPQGAAVEQKRITVGRCIFGNLGGDHAAVIDDHALAKRCAHTLRDQARDKIAATTSFRGEHADGFVGIGCGRDGAYAAKHESQCEAKNTPSLRVSAERVGVRDVMAGRIGGHCHGCWPSPRPGPLPLLRKSGYPWISHHESPSL